MLRGPARRHATGRVALVILVGLLGACAPLVRTAAVEGTVSRPRNVIARDLGISADIAGRVTWLFGDTFYHPRACDGTNLRHSTAAVDRPDGIVGNVTEPVDSCGAPAELVTPGVAATPGGARTAFWPDSIVPTLDGRAAVFYQRMLIDGDVWTVQQTSVAEMGAGPTTLDRTNEAVLFGPQERSYSAGNLVDGGFIYLYATDLEPDLRTAYRVARVPHALYRQRSAYRFWDGTGWSVSSIAAAKVVLRGVGDEGSGGLGGLTVSWNPYLRRYLMVHSEAWEHDLILRTAARPEGPWTAPTHVNVPDSASDSPFGSYTAREHPEFRSADGRTIVITYHRSTGGLNGELPVVRVVLR